MRARQPFLRTHVPGTDDAGLFVFLEQRVLRIAEADQGKIVHPDPRVFPTDPHVFPEDVSGNAFRKRFADCAHVTLFHRPLRSFLLP